MTICVLQAQAQILRDAKETGKQKVFVSTRTIIEQPIKEHASHDINMLSSKLTNVTSGPDHMKYSVLLKMPTLNIVFILDMPATNNLARAVNHSRKKQCPIDHRNLDSTSIGVQFLKGDIWVDHKRHIILASAYQRLLTTSVHWFGDGTFKLVKAPFTQLWSIHAFVKHGIIVKQVPLMFCLMSSQRKIHYDGVLRHLLPLLGQPCVQIVTSDFEAALWQSVIPHVHLVGCLFHYTHALYRQIQALGLQQSYQTDVGTKSLMCC